MDYRLGFRANRLGQTASPFDQAWWFLLAGVQGINNRDRVGIHKSEMLLVWVMGCLRDGR